MKETFSAKLLFDMLGKSFERHQIKSINYLTDGSRAVITYDMDDRDYEIIVKPVREESKTISSDDFLDVKLIKSVVGALVKKG